MRKLGKRYQQFQLQIGRSHVGHKHRLWAMNIDCLSVQVCCSDIVAFLEEFVALENSKLVDQDIKSYIGFAYL